MLSQRHCGTFLPTELSLALQTFPEKGGSSSCLVCRHGTRNPFGRIVVIFACSDKCGECSSAAFARGLAAICRCARLQWGDLCGVPPAHAAPPGDRGSADLELGQLPKDPCLPRCVPLEVSMAGSHRHWLACLLSSEGSGPGLVSHC